MGWDGMDGWGRKGIPGGVRCESGLLVLKAGRP